MDRDKTTRLKAMKNVLNAYFEDIKMPKNTVSLKSIDRFKKRIDLLEQRMVALEMCSVITESSEDQEVTDITYHNTAKVDRIEGHVIYVDFQQNTANSKAS